MRPLHRLADWDIAGGWAPFVFIVIGWMALGFGVWSLTGPIQNTARSDPRDGMMFTVSLFGVAVVGCTIARLWMWEDRRIKAQTSAEDRIAELERELGIGK